MDINVWPSELNWPLPIPLFYTLDHYSLLHICVFTSHASSVEGLKNLFDGLLPLLQNSYSETQAQLVGVGVTCNTTYFDKQVHFDQASSILDSNSEETWEEMKKHPRGLLLFVQGIHIWTILHYHLTDSKPDWVVNSQLFQKQLVWKASQPTRPAHLDFTPPTYHPILSTL